MNVPDWWGALCQEVIQGPRILSLWFCHPQSVTSKAAVLVCIQQMEGERERGTGLKDYASVWPHSVVNVALSLGHIYLQRD